MKSIGCSCIRTALPYVFYFLKICICTCVYDIGKVLGCVAIVF